MLLYEEKKKIKIVIYREYRIYKNVIFNITKRKRKEMLNLPSISIVGVL